jgi:hypothetical protein
MWVQTALNALNSPAVGWVTTTFSAENTFPPPTGISLVLASAAFLLFPACPDPDVLPDDELLPPPHAARVAARPAKPAPASAARRVVSRPGKESCVTMSTSGHGRIGAPTPR